MFFRFSGEMVELFLPILGNMSFLPIISTLFNVFKCTESTGDSFTDSFMDKDCYEYCWKNDHLIFALISLFALMIYHPLAVYARPLW